MAETEKPRVRVKAWTTDSFQNFVANVGIGTNNLMSAATYGFNPITRNRQLLEWMYRGSWIVRKCVDAKAEDMTKAGVTLGGAMKPSDSEKLQATLNDLGVWNGLTSTAKWARLYGGCIAVILIDGQKNEKPLRLDTVDKDAFRGLAVLDRWMLSPSLTDLVRDGGTAQGLPRFYDVTVEGGPLPRQRIHHSRVIRMDGLELPFWQRYAENGWGLSVIEPLYDRLVAFDSTTAGAAQLVFKAHLRTLKVPNLREIVAAGGDMMKGLTAQVDAMRLFQANEGITLIDGEDEVETTNYTFSGLDDVLLQFGQQLSGAMDTPLVRLFGQSPAGLNSTGESDLRTYYDGCARDQGSQLRVPVTKILDVAHRSTFGRPAPDGFTFDFAPLWELSDVEKSEVGKNDTVSVTEAYGEGLISKPQALRELKASSRISGRWSTITDKEIKDAETEEAEAPDMNEGGEGGGGGQDVPAAEPDAGAQPGDRSNADEKPLQLRRSLKAV